MCSRRASSLSAATTILAPAARSDEKTRIWFGPQYPQPSTPIRTPSCTASPLIGPAEQQRRQGLEQDLHVLLDRPGLDVPDVQPHHFLERQGIPPADLPEARDPRQRLEPSLVPLRVSLHLVGDGRTRADQTHVAAHHVPQLRQLIQARAPEP